MSQRYVLNSLNVSNLNNLTRMDQSTLSKHSSRKELNSSMHSLSKTKTPTRLSSKAAKNLNKTISIDKYEELVAQCHELGKANSIMKIQRDQFCKAYHDLKFISQRQKIQLCQAFEELKASYVQLQNKTQLTQQTNVMKRVPSSIEKKLSSELEEAPASSIYTMKEQYYITLQENKNLKCQIDSIRRELDNARITLDKTLKEKYEISHHLQTTKNELKVKMSEGKSKSVETIRQQLHRQSQQRYVLGLQSQKNLNHEVSKISMLMQQNHNLIMWKQNLQKHYLSQIKRLSQTIFIMNSTNQEQLCLIHDKDTLIDKLQSHLQAVTFQNDKINQRSKIAESEIDKLKAESMQVKQKASEQYQTKIAEILGKAFNLSTQ